MKTTIALLTLAAGSLVAAPQQAPSAGSQPNTPSTTQPKKAKKAKRHRTRKGADSKPQDSKANPPKK